jgi:hypothetical protein
MSVTQLRILVFDLPPLLSDLVRRALDSNRDIVSISAKAGGLERAIAESHPNAVIVPLDDGLLTETREFLEDRARLRVLGISFRDGRSVLYELRPSRSELGEVAPDELPALIRTALAREVSV